jgi:hypothetical protein
MKPGPLEVGPLLRLSGPRLPAGAARDGLGAWVLKGLRIYRQRPRRRHCADRCRHFPGSRNSTTATDSTAAPPTPSRSSKLDALPESAEAGADLPARHGLVDRGQLQEPLWRSDPSYREQLLATYGARLYAFEHRSLTESPIANALDAGQDPAAGGACLHLLSHSRGGMVGELLARANRDRRGAVHRRRDRSLPGPCCTPGPCGFRRRGQAPRRTQPRTAQASPSASSASCASPARRAARRSLLADSTAGPASCSTCSARASMQRALVIPGMLPLARGLRSAQAVPAGGGQGTQRRAHPSLASRR